MTVGYNFHTENSVGGESNSSSECTPASLSQSKIVFNDFFLIKNEQME